MHLLVRHGEPKPSGSCAACFVFVFRAVPKLSGSGRVLITDFFPMNFWELCSNPRFGGKGSAGFRYTTTTIIYIYIYCLYEILEYTTGCLDAM